LGQVGITRSTVKHTAIYGSAAALGKLAGFIMLPVYAHSFGAVGYGVIGLLDTSLALFLSLLAGNLNGGIVRFYHELEPDRKSLAVSTGLILVTVVASAMLVVTLALSVPFSSLLLGDSSYYPLVCLAFLGMFFDLVGQTAASDLIIRQRSVAFSLVSLLRLLLGLTLNIYLIVILEMGLVGYFLANLAGAVVTALIFLVLCIRRCGLRFDAEVARGLAAFQLPLIPGSLAEFVGAQIERVLVRFQIDLASVGVLSMSYRFPGLLFLLITQPFMRTWSTKRLQLAEEDRANAQIVTGKMYSLYLYTLLFAALVAAVNIDTFLRIIAPSEFWPAARLVRVQMVTVIVMSSGFYLNFGLYFNKETKLLALISAVGSGFKVVVSFILISLWGIDGAAYAALMAGLLRFAWSVSAAQKRFRIVLEHRKIAIMVVCALVLCVAIILMPLSSAPATRYIESQVATTVAGTIAGTAVAEWKQGAVLRAIEDRSADIALLIVKTALCLCFLLVFPVTQGGFSGLRDRLRAFQRN